VACWDQEDTQGKEAPLYSSNDRELTAIVPSRLRTTCDTNEILPLFRYFFIVCPKVGSEGGGCTDAKLLCPLDVDHSQEWWIGMGAITIHASPLTHATIYTARFEQPARWLLATARTVHVVVHLSEPASSALAGRMQHHVCLSRTVIDITAPRFPVYVDPPSCASCVRGSSIDTPEGSNTHFTPSVRHLTTALSSFDEHTDGNGKVAYQGIRVYERLSDRHMLDAQDEAARSACAALFPEACRAARVPSLPTIRWGGSWAWTG
jgi:hypothetical protein